MSLEIRWVIFEWAVHVYSSEIMLWPWKSNLLRKSILFTQAFIIFLLIWNPFDSIQIVQLKTKVNKKAGLCKIYLIGSIRSTCVLIFVRKIAQYIGSSKEMGEKDNVNQSPYSTCNIVQPRLHIGITSACVSPAVVDFHR